MAASPTPETQGQAHTKVCPDCAESVLAAARKCRFCGHRFDEPRRGTTRGLLERLGIWRPQRLATMDEVLADWGIAMVDGEQAASFRYVAVDDQPGYLLVTNRRMLFVGDHRRDQAPLFEYPPALVRRVQAVHSGRRLIVWANASRHVIDVRGGSAAREVQMALDSLSEVTKQ